MSVAWQRDGRTVYVAEFIEGGTRNRWSARVDSSAHYLTDREAENIAKLMAAAPVMFAALKSIEAHHARLNAAAGRDENRSATLRMAREALDLIER